MRYPGVANGLYVASSSGLLQYFCSRICKFMFFWIGRVTNYSSWAFDFASKLCFLCNLYIMSRKTIMEQSACSWKKYRKKRNIGPGNAVYTCMAVWKCVICISFINKNSNLIELFQHSSISHNTLTYWQLTIAIHNSQTTIR